MSLFKSVFPFMVASEIPENIKACLADYAFKNLSGTLHESKGFDYLTPGNQFIVADNRWLFKYIENKRTANRHAVNMIFQEWLQKATEDGREPDKESQDAYREQATREVLKTAPISETVVFILFDANVGRAWCAGSTVSKCQAALRCLRRAIGSLKTTPLTYDFAGRLLSRQLCKGMQQAEGFPDNLFIYPNGKLVAASEDQKVTFDGVDLRDEGVGEVLSGMEVRALEIALVKPETKGDHEVVATCVLHVPQTGPVHIKAFDYNGAAAGAEGDEAHHYATEMLIVSGLAWEIFDTLRAWFHGANGATQG